MSFLYPAFLLGALAVALPIILHLLRRDVAPEVPFSAVRLLRRSPIDRSRRRRLRDLILLAARVAALLLLACAFARPYFTSTDAQPGVRIVAVDRSFSMGAPGRFERALELAREAVDGAGSGDRVAVIGFDDRADVLATAGGAGEARAALDALKPGYGATRYAPAILRAIELAGDSPARVVVISDLQRNGWEDEAPLTVPANVQIEPVDAAAGGANVAVTAVRVEPERVVATVQNGAATSVASVARLIVDGRESASAPVAIGPNETADVTVPYAAPAQGTLAVSIDDASGYPADNSRFAILDPMPRARVLVLATAGAAQAGRYVLLAIEAAEHEPFEARVASGPELSSMSPADAATYAAVVVLSTRGLDRPGRDLLTSYVNAGGGVLVAAGPDVDASVLAPALGWPRLAGVKETDGPPLALAVSDVQHPVFRPFGTFVVNLGQVRFDRAWTVPSEDADVAARFTDGTPALLERRHGNGRVLIFASDLDRRWNAFPLHPSFVPFVVEAVRHVAATHERARDYVVGRAPAGAGPAPGIYKTRDGRRVAVNVDVRESAAARLTTAEFAAMLVQPAGPAHAGPDQGQTGVRPGSDPGQTGVRPTELRARTVEAQQNLWQYGLGLMLVVLVVESVVGRRM